MLDAANLARRLGFALYLRYIDDPEACALAYLAVQSSHRRLGIGAHGRGDGVTLSVGCALGKVTP